MTRPFNYLTLAAALCCAAFATAAEQRTPDFVSVEQAFESNSAAIVLPSGLGSALIVTPCAGCTPVLARATATTAYFLHKQRVSLPEFKAALLGKTVAVTVFAATRNGALTRVIADLDAPQPAARTR